uniref:LOW QUALITY PROTEIN: uncharacterized protein LOC120336095 n=1 Tax=Styela clava TaxID=7725 RepID=UPI0019396BE4|nr:LOW QUALITY PROTEIN: uncharacterized protein LOC120336095 [Styela clava]
MSGRVCCVIKCTNHAYKLQKWKSSHCPIRNVSKGEEGCICTPPFELHPFPTELKDPEGRQNWIDHNINREEPGSSKCVLNWQPTKYSRVCSIHFVDGRPTSSNPYPTLCMGYRYETSIVSNKRCLPSYKASYAPKCKKRRTEVLAVPTNLNFEHNYCLNADMGKLAQVIKSLKIENAKLRGNNRNLRSEVAKLKCSFRKVTALPPLHTDKSVAFYTGFPSKKVLDKVTNLLRSKAPRTNFLKGNAPRKRIISSKILMSARMHKLSFSQQLIMTLMRLTLGLLITDLAERFHVSQATASRVIGNMLKFLSHQMKSLINNPSRYHIMNLPRKFRIRPYNKVR